VREALHDSTASWMGAALEVLIPQGLTAQAAYHSWISGENESKALVLADGALYLFEMSFLEPRRGHVNDVRSVTSVVSLRDVQSVTGEATVAFRGGQGDAHRREDEPIRVTVTLAHPLGSIGEIVSLPFEESDYSGSRERQVQACHRFLEALTQALSR
jgi:hypothetical protein